jgi:hypothetical protein
LRTLYPAIAHEASKGIRVLSNVQRPDSTIVCSWQTPAKQLVSAQVSLVSPQSAENIRAFAAANHQMILIQQGCSRRDNGRLRFSPALPKQLATSAGQPWLATSDYGVPLVRIISGTTLAGAISSDICSRIEAPNSPPRFRSRHFLHLMMD